MTEFADLLQEEFAATHLGSQKAKSMSRGVPRMETRVWCRLLPVPRKAW